MTKKVHAYIVVTLPDILHPFIYIYINNKLLSDTQLLILTWCLSESTTG